MLTIKHYAGSELTVYSCDRYTRQAEGADALSLYSKAGGWETVPVEPGDAVYVENLHGKTIDSIRRPRG